MGPAGLIVTYPMRGGKLLNFAASVERSDWTNESWSETGTVVECLRDFPGWHPDIREVIGAVEIPYKWALLARDPLPRWSAGRVSLLGDAAHPLLPFLGQGANMAIEDGMVLARCLDAEAGIADGLRRYEGARLNRASRVARVTLESVSHMRDLQLTDPALAQVFMDSLFGAKTPDTRFEWIYEYDAMNVTV
jgi:salicylate hydroxylase